MKKQEYFYQVFRRSVSDVSYYRELTTRSFWFSLKYLYFLLVLTSLVISVIFALFLRDIAAKAPPYILQLKSDLATLYPAGLAIRVQSGSVSTNAKGPVIVALPASWKKVLQKSSDFDSIDHFLVIDTKASPSDFSKEKTLFLLTQHELVAADSSNAHNFTDTGYRVRPIDPKISTKPITRRTYDAGLEILFPELDRLPIALGWAAAISIVVLPFLLALIFLIGSLFWLLLTSLVLWIIASIWGKALGFGELYRLSMHGMTLSILYGLAQTLLGFSIPLGLSAVLMIWMIFVMREFPSVER